MAAIKMVIGLPTRALTTDDVLKNSAISRSIAAADHRMTDALDQQPPGAAHLGVDADKPVQFVHVDRFDQVRVAAGRRGTTPVEVLPTRGRG